MKINKRRDGETGREINYRCYSVSHPRLVGQRHEIKLRRLSKENRRNHLSLAKISAWYCHLRRMDVPKILPKGRPRIGGTPSQTTIGKDLPLGSQ